MSWPRVSFGDVLTDATGGNIKTKQSDYLGEGQYAIVDQGQSVIGGYTDEETSLCKVDGPVIIFGDHTKALKYVDFPFCLGADGTKVLKPKPGTHPKYLYYALHQVPIPEAGYSRHFKYLKAGEIPLPPLAEQKRIARVLDQAAELCRLRSRALEKLNSLGQAIFHEMFGDPGTNPMSWPICSIGDLLAEAKYGTSAKANTEGRGLPVLRMGNITYDGRIDLADLKHVELSEKDVPKYTTQLGDILFNRTNSKELVGKTAVVNFPETMAIAGYLVRGRVNSAGNPYYISAFMNSKRGKAVLQGMCKNIVGMANINAKEFQSILLPKPPKELQDQYEGRLEAIEPLAKQIKVGLGQSNALFASLQHRAFRGEL